MASPAPPRTITKPNRERITPAALSAQVAALHQQARELEQSLGNFLAATELQISMQPSLTTAHRNLKATLNHLVAAGTLAMAQVRQEAGK
jgi:tRNA A37 threonylcarbamoyladenosine synthetase subunit TsaC/SUA5/YrdC